MDTENNRYFRMGAAVAVGEMFDGGVLGSGPEALSAARSFLTSFGVRSMEDVAGLGITGPCRRDFASLFAAV